jgi:hypothetical protein
MMNKDSVVVNKDNLVIFKGVVVKKWIFWRKRKMRCRSSLIQKKNYSNKVLKEKGLKAGARYQSIANWYEMCEN